MTLAHVLYSYTERQGLSEAAYRLILVVAGSLLITLSAQVAIRLPFSPVPFTMQTFAVLLAGAVMGSRLGAASVLLYLAQGAMGLPVFAGGGAGVLYMFGPTGGYLFGFLAAAFTTGLLAERGWDRRTPSAAAAMLVGNAVIYLCGAWWLASFVGGLEKAVALGIMPFLVGDTFKVAAASLLLPGAWAVIGRRG